MSLVGDCQSSTQVFHINGTRLKNARGINLKCIPEAATLVLNVSGRYSSIKKASFWSLADRAETVLFNFYEAKSLDIADVKIEGSILAPLADIKNSNSELNGQVMARSCKGSMKFHHRPFKGRFPWHDHNDDEDEEPGDDDSNNGGGETENVAPNCDTAFAKPALLWPPNHKFSKVSITGITDANNDELDIETLCIFQDEPLNSQGDGHTSYDATGIGEKRPQLRKERQGRGNGRVYHIDFRATDPYGESCLGSVSVAVPKSKRSTAIDGGRLYQSVPSPYECGGNTENEAPIITSTAPTEAVAETTYQYQVEANDPDGDSLTYRLSSSPEGMGVSDNGLIEWLPSVAQVGAHDVAVLVEDGEGGTVSQSFTLVVAAQPNSSPTIDSVPGAQAVEAQTYIYNVNASDADGDTLVYSLTSAPEGMSMDASSGVLQWVPALGSAGNYNVSIAVEDNNGGVAVQEYLLSVQARPIPPPTLPAHRSPKR